MNITKTLTSKLFFTNVHSTMDQDDMERFFQKHAQSAQVIWMKHNHQNASTFIEGVVEFDSPQEAKEVMDKCQHYMLGKSETLMRHLYLGQLAEGEEKLNKDAMKQPDPCCFCADTTAHNLEQCTLPVEKRIEAINRRGLCWATGKPTWNAIEVKKPCGVDGCQVFHLPILHSVFLHQCEYFRAMKVYSICDSSISIALKHGWVTKEMADRLEAGLPAMPDLVNENPKTKKKVKQQQQQQQQQPKKAASIKQDPPALDNFIFVDCGVARGKKLGWAAVCVNNKFGALSDEMFPTLGESHAKGANRKAGTLPSCFEDLISTRGIHHLSHQIHNTSK